jgi:hypothetical protein
MLGISYILRRLGFIKEPPSRPRNGNNHGDGKNNNNSNEEGLLHGSA